MKILAIESSSLVASAAVLEDDIIKAEYVLNNKKTHSQTLLPMIDAVLRHSETEASEIDAVAVSSGPGSFTGLRIGAATAKGIGMALNKPLIAVPTLDMTAYNLYKSPALICPMMDARRNQVYTGFYKNNNSFEVIKSAFASDIRQVLEELEALGEEVIFLGDGVPVYKAIIEENLACPHYYAPAHISRQRASALACLAAVYYGAGKIIAADKLELEYLRKSQAEREQENK